MKLDDGAVRNPAALGRFVGGAIGGAGLKPEDSGPPTTGPDDAKGIAGCGVGGALGLMPGKSDPTTGPDDEKGVIV